MATLTGRLQVFLDCSRLPTWPIPSIWTLSNPGTSVAQVKGDRRGTTLTIPGSGQRSLLGTAISVEDAAQAHRLRQHYAPTAHRPRHPGLPKRSTPPRRRSPGARLHDLSAQHRAHSLPLVRRAGIDFDDDEGGRYLSPPTRRSATRGEIVRCRVPVPLTYATTP
jgi:hypothetical protein